MLSKRMFTVLSLRNKMIEMGTTAKVMKFMDDDDDDPRLLSTCLKALQLFPVNPSTKPS